MTVTKARV